MRCKLSRHQHQIADSRRLRTTSLAGAATSRHPGRSEPGTSSRGPLPGASACRGHAAQGCRYCATSQHHSSALTCVELAPEMIARLLRGAGSQDRM